MGIRLNKVTQQLNIGIHTAVEFLKLNHVGYIKEDANPNTKITDEQYNALVKHFSVDRRVKANAKFLSKKASNNKQESEEGGKKNKKSSTPIVISSETKQKWDNKRRINRFLRSFVATGWGICDKGAEGALILSEG